MPNAALASVSLVLADYHNPLHGAHLLQLLDEYARHPMGGGHALTLQAHEQLLGKLAAIPNAFSVLAYCGNQPVGLANCFQGFSTFKCQPLINIHDLVVTESHRGQGVVKLLVNKIEAVARERDCCKITLEVLQGNRSAQQAYRKLGFESYELDPEIGIAMFWEKYL
ncbi:GNAT family N-acetyltransferase [Thiolinea disciformis]|uniref:GNAT family N-acetyltransferase n=1 Tax=Thiolinea disciformis TaxID=125614 RepID=UPI00036C4F3E|nr:GNAT family N-acetyltransferase [Thiolinea disciformis]